METIKHLVICFGIPVLAVLAIGIGILLADIAYRFYKTGKLPHIGKRIPLPRPSLKHLKEDFKEPIILQLDLRSQNLKKVTVKNNYFLIINFNYNDISGYSELLDEPEPFLYNFKVWMLKSIKIENDIISKMELNCSIRADEIKNLTITEATVTNLSLMNGANPKAKQLGERWIPAI